MSEIPKTGKTAVNATICKTVGRDKRRGDKVNQHELDKILADHKRWVKGEDGGKRADLSWANLRGANLIGANLSWANLIGADLIGAVLSKADLSWANLSGAVLSKADLRGADVDFSCWPLWCGSKGVRVDMRLVRQLLAHVACLDCADPAFGAVKAAILPEARKSHRAGELGLLGENQEARAVAGKAGEV